MTALVSILVAVALLFGGAGTTALAAQDSLPDEWLYPVKLATENVRLELALGDQQEVQIRLGLADRRVDELRRLAEAGGPIQTQTSQRLRDQWQEALIVAARLGDSQMVSTLEQVRTRLRAEERTLTQLQTMGGAPSDQTIAAAQQTVTQALAAVDVGLHDPAGFRLRFGRGRPDSAPPQPDIAPGEGQPGGGPGTPSAANPITGDTLQPGQSLPGGMGISTPGDGTCDGCTPQSWDWSGTPGPHGAGSGGQGGGGWPSGR